MRESGYYPDGAEFDKNAPYNQDFNPEREIEVVVSMTISKSFKIYVNDYTKEKGDNGETLYDYSSCNLEKAIRDQVYLPCDSYKYVSNLRIRKDLIDWDVDDFTVTLE